jgi:glycosyltransferase involved in cell wall biosynthesis
MRILIATDAWEPQINGVVRTYQRLIVEAAKLGAEVTILSPSDFKSLALPVYPEIRLALPAIARARRIIRDGNFDYIHIATEGPVGLMTRRAARQLGRPFTTSYHTRFPEYAHELIGVPPAISRWFLRRFHNSGIGTMVATCSLRSELKAQGFRRLLPWTRGVDTELFRPRECRIFGTEKPVFLYAGRVSREKNLEAFLALRLPGRKVVVGDGPHRAALQETYPDALFTGTKTGEDLASAYASADVFIFPSLTDTFGLVIVEALSCGVPVAAFPVTGPIDILDDGVNGAIDRDLGAAALKALKLSRDSAREHGLRFSWQRTAELFLNNIEAAHRRAGFAVAKGARRRRSGPRPGLIPPALPEGAGVSRMPP